MDSAKPIYKFLLKQNSQLVALVTQGRALHEAKAKLKPYINQYIKTGWRVGNISPESITLLVDSAESANRLRYQSTILISELRKLAYFRTLAKISIKVAPPVRDTAAKPRRLPGRLLRSKTGQRHLLSLADTIDDAKLKASLQRLADHLQD